jgi:hypothetical protein
VAQLRMLEDVGRDSYFPRLYWTIRWERLIKIHQRTSGIQVSSLLSRYVPHQWSAFPFNVDWAQIGPGLEDLSPHVESDGLYCWLVFQYVGFWHIVVADASYFPTLTKTLGYGTTETLLLGAWAESIWLKVLCWLIVHLGLLVPIQRR